MMNGDFKLPVGFASASSLPSTESGHAVLTSHEGFVVKLVSLVGNFVRAVHHGHHFGISHVEESGAIGGGDYAHLGMQVTHLVWTATIQAQTLRAHVLSSHLRYSSPVDE